ncbi:NIPSNAP family protein [Veronia pacifica]|uniref:NIPSNAP family protein n=1 Tax=Veronia pacifica TaxID=1080227 RepID=UPI001FDEAF8A|nr:NIPSNAP family protein [Veronia pacifica]
MELREYKLRPGMMKKWLVWMESQILPYQISKGMKVLNTFTHEDEQGEQWFIWLREFQSMEHREEVYARTYNEWWKETMRPKVFEHIYENEVRVRLLSPQTLMD